MATIMTEKEVHSHIDENGIERTDVKETTRKIERSTEPDFIKLYTKMWCEFNEVPDAYRGLFLELVVRMTYCNSSDLESSQLVNTGSPWSDSIMAALDWKKAMYQRGLRALCDCGAIRKVGRGVYQVNPLYAGRGEWKYNPRLNRGGVEDLIATFNFKDKTVNTKITWADDGEDTPVNKEYRKGLGVSEKDHTVLKTTVTTPEQVEGQMSIEDYPDFANTPIVGEHKKQGA